MNDTTPINEQAVASVIAALHAEGAMPDRAAHLLRRAAHELRRRVRVSSPPAGPELLGSNSIEAIAGGSLRHPVVSREDV